MDDVAALDVPESLRMTDSLEIELIVRRRAGEAKERIEALLAAVNGGVDRGRSGGGVLLVGATGPLQGAVAIGSRFSPLVLRLRDHTRVSASALDRELARTSAGFQTLVRDVLDRLVAEARSLNEMAADADALRTEDDVDGRHRPCTVLVVPSAATVDADPALAEVCRAYHEGRRRLGRALDTLERRVELQRHREAEPELLTWWRRRGARKELARESAVQRRLLHAAFDELSELDPVDAAGLVDAHVAAQAVIATLDLRR